MCSGHCWGPHWRLSLHFAVASMAEFWRVNRRIISLSQDTVDSQKIWYVCSNTVVALPTTAVLPTHTTVFGKKLMPFRIHQYIFLVYIFGLMFLSPKNAKLVLVRTNLRGDSSAVVYYTGLPRENPRDLCVRTCGNSIGALRCSVLWFLERPLWLSENVWNVTKEANEGPKLPSRNRD